MSDDIYMDLSYDQLFREWSKIKKELKKYQLLKDRGTFTEKENKRYIAKYTMILERNEAAVFRRLLKLA